MTKCGRLASSEYQGCYSHALHLAVTYVLYKKSAVIENDNTDDELDENENENDMTTTNEDEDETDITFVEDTQTREDLADDIHSAIVHVRQDVKKIRKSPKSNESLQTNVRASFGKELKLILDVKTRWNSFFDMLQRYCKLRSCIVKTMVDILVLS